MKERLIINLDPNDSTSVATVASVMSGIAAFEIARSAARRATI